MVSRLSRHNGLVRWPVGPSVPLSVGVCPVNSYMSDCMGSACH